MLNCHWCAFAPRTGVPHHKPDMLTVCTDILPPPGGHMYEEEEA